MPEQDLERRVILISTIGDPYPVMRVAGLFAARGYVLESLAYTGPSDESGSARITLVTSGTPELIMHIKARLEALVCTREVSDVATACRISPSSARPAAAASSRLEPDATAIEKFA